MYTLNEQQRISLSLQSMQMPLYSIYSLTVQVKKPQMNHTTPHANACMHACMHALFTIEGDSLFLCRANQRQAAPKKKQHLDRAHAAALDVQVLKNINR